MPVDLTSFTAGGLAVVIGASGGIGGALVDYLIASGRFSRVIGLSRSSQPAIDVGVEQTLADAARYVNELGEPVRLVFIATGFLHGRGFQPEKTWRHLDSAHLLHAFTVNAIGPALIMKHFLPLLSRQSKTALAVLSAKVGSIGDNRLGGWYSYRASKAALNQLVRTAASELRRTHPEAICIALHPGTVDTALSAPFAKSGLDVQAPAAAAAKLLGVIDARSADDSGGFFDYRGQSLPW